jgi:hypothetical protein
MIPGTLTFGCYEGDVCGRYGCRGTINLRPSENCSCHINPPCSSCTDPRHYCSECDWEEKYDDEWDGATFCSTALDSLTLDVDDAVIAGRPNF